MKKLSLLALVAVMADSAVFAEQAEHLFVESYDGAHFKCELRLPVGEGPHPALMYIHGGRGGQPPGPNYARYVRSYMLADECPQGLAFRYRPVVTSVSGTLAIGETFKRS